MLSNQQKNIYFLSDFHLGAPNYEDSLVREKKIVAFLNFIEPTAKEIFIVGDMFDFWYEYTTVIPKGFTRILGKLAALTDAGIAVHFFIGNHDMWMNGYFEKELNIKVYSQPIAFTRNNLELLIGHGDGLGPGDEGYKFIKKIFTNPICKWLFGQMHPTMGMGIANFFSKKSRQKTGNSEAIFLGEDKEWLVCFCKEVLQKKHYDYFVFGHRHLPIQLQLNSKSTYINLGDWITHFTYAVLIDGNITLEKWQH
jgi:UDP-2,3-diacylglucosamine hydrolase